VYIWHGIECIYKLSNGAERTATTEGYGPSQHTATCSVHLSNRTSATNTEVRWYICIRLSHYIWCSLYPGRKLHMHNLVFHHTSADGSKVRTCLLYSQYRWYPGYQWLLGHSLRFSNIFQTVLSICCPVYILCFPIDLVVCRLRIMKNAVFWKSVQMDAWQLFVENWNEVSSCLCMWTKKSIIQYKPYKTHLLIFKGPLNLIMNTSKKYRHVGEWRYSSRIS